MTKSKLVGYVAIGTGISTVALSMVLNVWAFTQQMEGVFGTTVGLLLPVWVLALTLAGKWGCEEKDRRVIGIGAYILAGFLLLVSLPHLAAGFSHISGGNMVEAWSLAIVTDLCQVICKLVLVTLAKESKPARKKKSKGKNKKGGVALAA